MTKAMVLSRKVRMKFIVAFLCAAIIFAAFRTLRKMDIFESLYSESKDQEKVTRKGKVVFLLSNQRSGSSFVGEFFARNDNGFYLYEPLHPYGMSCEQLYEERLDLLKDIAQCDFTTQRKKYRQAFAENGVKTNTGCLKNNICTPPRLEALLLRYKSLCKAINTNEDLTGNVEKECEMPVHLNIWSSLCQSSDIVAFKILRVCSVRSLERIIKELNALGNEVYVLDLVRDPRGVVNSALKQQLRKETLNARLDSLCGRFSSNLDYVEGEDAEPGGVVSTGRYMRIRYEDIAEDSVKGAERIYRFLGMTLPSEVKTWVESATSGVSVVVEELHQKLRREKISSAEEAEIKKKILTIKRESNSPFGTTRNSSSVLTKWRRELEMSIVNETQEKCSGVMKRLGYKIINNDEEKNNFAIRLW